MTINNIARNQMSDSMMRVASGKRINSAADDPAGMAILETMTSQLRGLDQGTRNTQDMQALVNTAEGGLDTVTDSLQRIRELSIQAMNDTNTPATREMIQQEIGQLADGIQAQVGGGVQFNGINLLDGSVTDFNTASGPDGSGATVTINDMSSLAQAVSNYNVTGSFDLSDIDNALNQVNSERASLGAMSNRFDYTINSNNITSINTAGARSRVGDADIAREMQSLKQERVIEEMQMLMQRRRQEDERANGQRLMTGM